MRLAITGSKGQLGSALQGVCHQDELLLIDLPEYDITALDIVAQTAAFSPDVIIHAAAITNVDGCETDPDLAYRVNVLGTRNMALAAQEANCPLVYISTDYVFDGSKGSPYFESDATSPQSIYATTKRDGETMVRNLLNRYYIGRIAWLYGDGPRNFVKTVLRLADERGEMTMVTDEIGSPTYAGDVARAVRVLIETNAYGTYHLTNSGITSRHGWAREILRLGGREDVTVHESTNYPRLAAVPKQVELKNMMGAAVGIVNRPWQEALAEYVQHLG